LKKNLGFNNLRKADFDSRLCLFILLGSYTNRKIYKGMFLLIDMNGNTDYGRTGQTSRDARVVGTRDAQGEHPNLDYLDRGVKGRQARRKLYEGAAKTPAGSNMRYAAFIVSCFDEKRV